MWLSDEKFSQVVSVVPLVSIDLIIRDGSGRVLLGKRSNRPAKGCWFVPGGRIQKDESIEAAFLRLSELELGYSVSIDKSEFIGVYQHFYADSVFGGDMSTHYVVLGFSLMISGEQLSALPAEQHDAYRWWIVTDLLSDDAVHDHTKDYFQPVQSLAG